MYGMRLYSAAWADELSSHPAGFQIYLSAQTFCFLCVVHLNRHVKEYVMWKVCLLKYASLIMVFPSISVSTTRSTIPHPLHSPPPPVSWRPYLFGAGCFAIKTPWWVLLLPSLASSAACNCILRSTHPPLPLICVLLYFQHILQNLCLHSSLGKKECF